MVAIVSTLDVTGVELLHVNEAVELNPSDTKREMEVVG